MNKWFSNYSKLLLLTLRISSQQALPLATQKWLNVFFVFLWQRSLRSGRKNIVVCLCSCLCFFLLYFPSSLLVFFLHLSLFIFPDFSFKFFSVRNLRNHIFIIILAWYLYCFYYLVCLSVFLLIFARLFPFVYPPFFSLSVPASSNCQTSLFNIQ